jgi:hypothetical protein
MVEAKKDWQNLGRDKRFAVVTPNWGVDHVTLSMRSESTSTPNKTSYASIRPNGEAPDPSGRFGKPR